MRRGSARVLGGLLLITCVVTYALAMLIFVSTDAEMSGRTLSTLVTLAGFLTFPVVGALIVTARPSNTVGWIFCVIGIGTATTSFSAGYVQHALATHADAQLATGLIDALGNGVWPLNLGLGSLLLLLFPDGKPLSRRWRFVAWVDVVALASTSLSGFLQPGPLEANGRVVNPVGIPALRPFLAALGSAGHLLIVPLVLIAVASVIVRYHRAVGMQRQQIKWFAYGAALMALLIFVTVMASTALTPSGQDPSNTLFSSAGFALAWVMLPLGAGIGVLRYRLYDIDILINRTLVYGSLTAILGALYFGCVVAMQQAVHALTGQSEQQQLVIVLSTLLIAALFDPLRRRIQRFIDRRFFRARYDVAKTLARFAATLRTETDLTELSEHLVGVVEETMQPAHASLWQQAMRTPWDGAGRAGRPLRGGAQ